MTTRFILEALMQVVLPTGLALLFLQHRTWLNYSRIAIFSLLYIVYQLILVLPRYGKPFNFIHSNWNWDGKIFAILLGILCYFRLRAYFAPNPFLTLKQEASSNKTTWIVTVSVVLAISILYYFIDSSEFDAETLAFQLLMPALDEELLFRGIFLGLLLTALPAKIRIFGNPSLLITGLLFGLMHALSLSKDYRIDFAPVSFFHTGVGVGFLAG